MGEEIARGWEAAVTSTGHSTPASLLSSSVPAPLFDTVWHFLASAFPPSFLKIQAPETQLLAPHVAKNTPLPVKWRALFVLGVLPGLSSVYL